MAVARLLARAWFHEHRRWWLGTGATLAVVLAAGLAATGALAGAQAAADDRVRDFYTGDLRITAQGEGAAPSTSFPATDASGLEALREGLRQASGADRVAARLEATGLVSRRSLAETALGEDDQVGIALPGTASDRDAYGVGILTGVQLADPVVQADYTPHLHAGRLPRPAPDDNATIEILASTWLWRSLLDDDERRRLGAPDATDLALVRLEVTAAHLEGSGAARDVIRFPARIVGLYSSGLDPLDQTTLVLDIGDARRLTGEPANGGAANVLTVHGGSADAAAAHAGEAGWKAEGPGPFAQRYLGQVVEVIGAMVWAATVLAVLLPLGLVWVALAQVLDQGRRELAVARALGVPRRSLAAALAILSGTVLAGALAGAAFLLMLADLGAPAWQEAYDSPLPAGFRLSAGTIAAVTLALLAATAAVWWSASRRASRIDLNTALRAA